MEQRNDSGKKSTTVFESTRDDVFQGVMQVALEENKAHRYTNVSNFSLKCGICKLGFRGQGEAQVTQLQFPN